MKKYIWIVLGFLIGLIAIMWLLNDTKVEAKSCKSENAECNVNDSNKLCCAGLTCMDKGVPSDNGKCQIAPTVSLTPTPTLTPSPTPKPPKDYCKNFEKDQKEIPYGMVSVEGICSCAEGYHQVDELEEVEVLDRKPKKEYDTFTCEKDVEPTPEPTPEVVRSSITVVTTPPCPSGQNCENVCTLPLKPATAMGGERLNKDTVRFNWFPSTDSHDKQVLIYGPSRDMLVHSVLDLPSETGYFDVNVYDMKHWWFSVGTWKDSCITWSNVIDP